LLETRSTICRRPEKDAVLLLFCRKLLHTYESSLSDVLLWKSSHYKSYNATSHSYFSQNQWTFFTKESSLQTNDKFNVIGYKWFIKIWSSWAVVKIDELIPNVGDSMSCSSYWEKFFVFSNSFIFKVNIFLQCTYHMVLTSDESCRHKNQKSSIFFIDILRH